MLYGFWGLGILQLGMELKECSYTYTPILFLPLSWVS